jgi:phosphoribosylanthranilate isomerase
MRRRRFGPTSISSIAAGRGSGALAERRSNVPAILAGGLRPENVAEAIAVARPHAVDVASGVEAEPGRKDHAAMAAFFEAAHEVART